MREGIRYAIYFVPEPDSALARLGSGILGRDSESGNEVPQPNLKGCTACRLLEITREPAKYGLHATLKAPFYLAAGYRENHLLQKAEAFAARHSALMVDRLRLKSLGSFLAAVPDTQYPGVEEQRQKLKALANDALAFFDPLRMETSPEELAKRSSRSLSPRQNGYLRQWGYPYVLEDYRFHITLTGRLRHREDTRNLKRILAENMEEALLRPLWVRSLCICSQEVSAGVGRNFQVMKRLYFSAS